MIFHFKKNVIFVVRFRSHKIETLKELLNPYIENEVRAVGCVGVFLYYYIKRIQKKLSYEENKKESI